MIKRGHQSKSGVPDRVEVPRSAHSLAEENRRMREWLEKREGPQYTFRDQQRFDCRRKRRAA